jgi:basic membrane protein A
MKKNILLLGGITLVLAGCGSTVSVEDPCSGYSEEDTVVGFATSASPINDNSFNEGTWNGIETMCSAYEVGAEFIEGRDFSEDVRNLTALAERNNVVVASGFTFEQAIHEVATKFPDVEFIYVDSQPFDGENYVDLPNVHSFLFKEEEVGYLVGYVAGMMTQTNHIGFIGGDLQPPVERFGVGYVKGAEDANPDIIVDYQYAGTFEDPAVGKTIADTMFTSGADIIFSAASATGTGVIEAAKNYALDGEEKWVIGVDSDQYEDGIYTTPEGEEKSVILTSAMKNVDKAVEIGLDAIANGNFTGGTSQLGIEQEGIGLPEENPNLPQDIIDAAYKALETVEEIPQDAKSLEETLTTATVNGLF